MDNLAYIKTPRALENTWVFESPKYWKWFTLIMYRVNYKPSEVLLNDGPLTINPGQSIISLQKWGEIFGCGKKTAKAFLEHLQKSGLIKYEIIGKGNRRNLLITLTHMANMAKTDTGNDTGNDTENDTENDPLYKKVKKVNNVKNNKPLKIPFSDHPEFLTVWEKWKAYRHEMKIKKYVPIGEQSALTKLKNESGNNPLIAIQMIENSIAAGYQGIFPLKPIGNNQSETMKRPSHKIL